MNCKRAWMAIKHFEDLVDAQPVNYNWLVLSAFGSNMSQPNDVTVINDDRIQSTVTLKNSNKVKQA